MNQRLSAFDNLRAFLALLGIPFHTVLFLAGYLYLEHADLMQLVQGASSQVKSFMLSVFYIHVFRMPIFFLLAGFFARLIYQQRGERKFIANRVCKIGLPFLFCISWAVILYFAIMKIAAFFPSIFPLSLRDIAIALYKIKGGAWGIINDVRSTWFLYDLLIFYSATLFVLYLKKHFCFVNKTIKKINWGLLILLTQRYCYLIVALFETVLLIRQDNLGFTTFENGLTPSLGLLSFYGVWYGMGWWLFGHQDKFMFLFRRSVLKLLLSIALYMFFLYWYFYCGVKADFYQRAIGLFFYQLSSVLAVFAFMGLFVNLISKQNKFLRYISGASYWIYLVQVPIVMTLVASTYRHGDNFFAASIRVSAISFIIALLSYQFFIRHAWLSRFLGGKINF